jgi:hypothetical protein
MDRLRIYPGRRGVDRIELRDPAETLSIRGRTLGEELSRIPGHVALSSPWDDRARRRPGGAVPLACVQFLKGYNFQKG